MLGLRGGDPGVNDPHEFERRLEALVDEARGEIDDEILVDALDAEIDRVERSGANNALAEFDG